LAYRPNPLMEWLARLHKSLLGGKKHGNLFSLYRELNRSNLSNLRDFCFANRPNEYRSERSLGFFISDHHQDLESLSCGRISWLPMQVNQLHQ
jgi:hypothetical protein